MSTAVTSVIALTEEIARVPREPDAVAWLALEDSHALATANEGDLGGGSRGMTVFHFDGTIIFDSGASFEEQAVQHGHYPEDRSENKGAVAMPRGLRAALRSADYHQIVIHRPYA